MNTWKRSRLIAGIGAVLLLVGLLLFYMSIPSYTTEIETKAPDKRALANEMELSSTSEMDTVAFANLSTTEKTAFKRARQSPQNQYSDRGASDKGVTFNYRNDLVNQYVVTYDRNLYLVAVVVDINPITSVSSVLTGISAITLLVFAYWTS